MSWILSGEVVLANYETRMVIDGRITFWTNNKSKSMMILQNPLTGNEDRLVLTSPAPWWVIQHQMQMFEEMLGGTPMLEVEHRPVGAYDCDTCSGSGGEYDTEGNWIDCPQCKGR